MADIFITDELLVWLKIELMLKDMAITREQLMKFAEEAAQRRADGKFTYMPTNG